MKHRVTVRTSFQFDPFILEVEAFKWEDNGDLILYDYPRYWRFPYKVLEYVHMEVIENDRT